jgi:homocysteine S-methyltransferase
MARYRHELPQTKGGIFLSDGGMETTLIFQDGIDLPHFASFVLLETGEGCAALKRYYESHLAVARQNEVGFVLDGATWRANPDWAAKLGYGSEALAAINKRSIAFIDALRSEWERPATPIALNGVIGPRGDGYKAGRMSAEEAEDYHSAQIATFTDTAADMVSAITMNTINEAVGIARAAKAHGMPCVLSFTVETDGRLVGGETLREAIETADELTEGYAAYYMVNCAHPTHFDNVLNAGEDWLARIHGVRANASAKSHAELDESTELDAGDPVDFGRRYRGLRGSLPNLRILGGCCGTDHRHVAAICEACLPSRALSA